MEKLIEVIEFYSTQLGFNVSSQTSSNHAGTFLKISNRDQAFLIRIADSQLPESYSILNDHVNFEVNNSNAGAHTWYDCVAWLAKQSYQSIPELAKQLLDERETKLKEMETRRLDEVVDKQFNRVFNDALSKCLDANKRLYRQYVDLQSKVKTVSHDNARQLRKYDKKLKVLNGQIISMYG